MSAQDLRLQALLRAAFPFVAAAADRGLAVHHARPQHRFRWHCRCYWCRDYYSRNHYRPIRS